MPLVTNIQKFSIHDGDGVRTTVFFKGCPLKCMWCHNPETQRFYSEVMLDESKCVGCTTCEHICPNGAITMEAGGTPGDSINAGGTPALGSAAHATPHTDLSLCTQCGKCEKFCTAVCRELVGKEYTVKELMKELIKDRMFYEDSGGGVTLSGGEVMSMDIDYILAIAKALDREDISLTIDTCGYTEYEKFEKLLPYVNTFLYDVKVIDPELHKKYIGVDNGLILDNLKKLSAAGARIYIRIPTIKGVSGTEENMRATIDFLKDNNIRVAQVNLLPYHNTGSSKYSRIGKEYEGTELQAPTNEEMEHYAQLFKEAGYLNTKIGG